MFPARISLVSAPTIDRDSVFMRVWSEAMLTDCHQHSVWTGKFVDVLRSDKSTSDEQFALASVWATNMVPGSYCFPRYVAALAARAHEDSVRHGLLENAWDESGSVGHT